MLPLHSKRPVLSSLALSGISLAGCGSASEPAAHPAEAASATASASLAAEAAPPPPAPALALPARKDPGLDLSAEIAARSVTSEALAFKVLYTWTTDAQLAELVKGDPLLSRSVSKKHGMSLFDDLVAAEAGRGRDVAKLLWHEAFAKKRFAWPSPYSALRGGDADGDYGRVLLRVELRPDAWILDYDRGIVHGLDGSRHTPTELLASPERLAAVYHNGPGFRELVLVSEAMIARVDGGGSKAARAAMTADVELLQALAAHLEDEPGDVAPAQAFPRTSIFQESMSPLELRKRAKVLDEIRALPQASLERELNASGSLEAVAKAFKLGAVRPTIPPYCKLVRRESKTQPAFRGSFAMMGRASSTTTFTALCEAADGSASGCLGSSAPTAAEAVCTPVPGFGQ